MMLGAVLCRWITAIEFLADFRKSYVEKRVTGDFDDSSQL